MTFLILPARADLFSRMGEERAKDAIEHFVRAAAASEATTYEKARASQGAGYASFQRNKPADALEHYARAEAAIEGLPDDDRHEEVRYEIHSGRGWVNRFVGNVDVAVGQLERAYRLAERSGVAGRLADAHINLGGAYDYAGDYEAARKYYREGVEHADTSGDHSYRSVARYMSGWFLIRHGPLDEGMRLCTQALKFAEEFEFGDFATEAAWILAVGYAREGRFDTALAMADSAAGRSVEFVGAWVLMIRGMMRLRVGHRGAADDFNQAVTECDESIDEFENFDPLDTRAFAHAGLAVLSHEGHEELAVRDYRRARELAPARGIVDIGKTVFSCFGSTPPVERIARRLFDSV